MTLAGTILSLLVTAGASSQYMTLTFKNSLPGKKKLCSNLKILITFLWLERTVERYYCAKKITCDKIFTGLCYY